MVVLQKTVFVIALPNGEGDELRWSLSLMQDMRVYAVFIDVIILMQPVPSALNNL